MWRRIASRAKAVLVFRVCFAARSSAFSNLWSKVIVNSASLDDIKGNKHRRDQNRRKRSLNTPFCRTRSLNW
jgi:hypothetical protein